jgi:hypothetical protein
MGRLHLFELEDQPWFPTGVRDAATDFLRFALHTGDMYAPTAPLLRDLLDRTGARQIVDLCSGGGGPWTRLLPALGPDVRVCLTDLYPNRQGMQRVQEESGGRITFRSEPVDATAVPADLPGVRTLFTALHHFRPEEARAVLADAVRQRQPVAAFEFTERSLRGLLLSAASPLLVWGSTPRIRPLRPARLLWTYLIPLVPLTVLVDGVVSSLRTYSPPELRELVAEFETYTWEIGTVRGPSAFAVTYLVGYPRESASRWAADASLEA